MATEQERAQELYAILKPEAAVVYVDHIVSRTPPELQDEMRTIAAADLSAGGGGGTPPLTDPTVASVADGASVAVNDSTGLAAPGSPATASVANSVLTAVQLGPVAQRAGIQQGPDMGSNRRR